MIKDYIFADINTYCMSTKSNNINGIADQITRLALSFSSIIEKWLTEDEMKEVNSRNKTEKYKADDLCATHDFCDPNHAMIDAFRIEFGKDLDLQKEEHIFLVNTAWAICKRGEFKTY